MRVPELDEIILNHDGFAGNEAKQMITANDDVWEAYMKV